MRAWLRAFAVLLLAAAASACATSTRLHASDYRQFAGRTYVVVGASSGFGRGTALALGRQRANVVVAARRTELLEEVAREIRAWGGQALVVTTDAGDPRAVEALAAEAVQRFGRIDVWMNIAGVGAIGRFWDVPAEDYSRLIDTNVKGVIYGSRVALRQFTRQGHGTLVNMGSLESEVPLAYHAVYAASKASVLSLGRSLTQELRHAGLGRTVKVATVMPWAADTPWWRHAANYSGHQERMILVDDPAKIIQALLWVSLHPKQELPVGWKAQGAYTAHRILPDLTERIAADIHRRELNKASPAPATSGSLHRPMEEGRTTEGGWRAHMKAEDEARKRRTGPR